MAQFRGSVVVRKNRQLENARLELPVQGRLMFTCPLDTEDLFSGHIGQFVGWGIPAKIEQAVRGRSVQVSCRAEHPPISRQLSPKRFWQGRW